MGIYLDNHLPHPPPLKLVGFWEGVSRNLPVYYLIFVKLTIFICGLAFVLKGDDDETNEYINHKKGNDNNINEIKARYNLSVVVYRPMVFLVRINGNVEDAKNKI